MAQINLSEWEHIHERAAVDWQKNSPFKIGEKKLIKYDPQIIKWIAVMKSVDDKSEITETYIPLHDCTEQDFKEFSPL